MLPDLAFADAHQIQQPVQPHTGDRLACIFFNDGFGMKGYNIYNVRIIRPGIGDVKQKKTDVRMDFGKLRQLIGICANMTAPGSPFMGQEFENKIRKYFGGLGRDAVADSGDFLVATPAILSQLTSGPGLDQGVVRAGDDNARASGVGNAICQRRIFQRRFKLCHQIYFVVPESDGFNDFIKNALVLLYKRFTEYSRKCGPGHGFNVGPAQNFKPGINNRPGFDRMRSAMTAQDKSLNVIRIPLGVSCGNISTVA